MRVRVLVASILVALVSSAAWAALSWRHSGHRGFTERVEAADPGMPASLIRRAVVIDPAAVSGLQRIISIQWTGAWWVVRSGLYGITIAANGDAVFRADGDVLQQHSVAHPAQSLTALFGTNRLALMADRGSANTASTSVERATTAAAAAGAAAFRLWYVRIHPPSH